MTAECCKIFNILDSYSLKASYTLSTPHSPSYDLHIWVGEFWLLVSATGQVKQSLKLGGGLKWCWQSLEDSLTSLIGAQLDIS